MGRALVRLAGLLAVTVAVAGLVFFVGMRTNAPAVTDRVRRFNRAVTNRRVLRTAGTPGAGASVVHHVGRTTGRSYETPVGPIETADGFLVALPYGRRSDWLRNVLAAGGATLVHEGSTFVLDRPEIIETTAVTAELPEGERRVLALFRVEECLRLRHAGTGAGTAAPAHAGPPAEA